MPRNVVFVSLHPIGEALRGAQAAKALADVRLLGVCETPPAAADVFDDLETVADAHDAAELLAAVRRLADANGPLDRIVGVRETLLEPIAAVSEQLGLPGPSVDDVRRVLDKSLMTETLRAVGIPTGRSRFVVSLADALDFVADVGLPIVLKPPSGSGGLATWRIRTQEELETAIGLLRPRPGNAALAAANLAGTEVSVETITVRGEPVFSSMCRYEPTILDALEDPAVQWRCVLPRDISSPELSAFRAAGLEAVRALVPGDAMTHMEGFLLDGGGFTFNDATIRPAGARIAPMTGFAHDVDPYRAWARLAVDGEFDGPWERKFAVGTVFLRGIGRGRVAEVRGLEAAGASFGHLVVEARLPRVGAPRSETYTGDGYVTVRHPETEVVEDALRRLADVVEITYSGGDGGAEAPEDRLRDRWSLQMQYFAGGLNRPAWDDESAPRLGEP